MQDIYRVLSSCEEIVIMSKYSVEEWRGLVKDIPNRYFDYLIDNIYSVVDDYSCIVIYLKS